MIIFSEKESEVLGVRIARGVLDHSWQPGQLQQAALAGKHDFLRLKLPSNDEQVFAKLDAMGMHYCLHSILVRNSIEITAAHNFLYRNLRVEFELFDGSNEAAMKQLVKDSWGARTAVNYHNSYFRNWVSYEQEIEGSAAYACEFNYSVNPTMPNWIVKLQQKPIGFVLGKISEEGFEGVMYSIVPEFRGHNYAEDIMMFLKKWCFQQGIARFYNDVVFQNMPSLKSIVTESIVPVETYLNVTISTLLSATKSAPKELEIDMLNRSNSLMQLVATYGNFWEKSGSALLAVNSTLKTKQLNEISSLRVSEPVNENGGYMVLLLCYSSEVAIGAIYLRYKD